MNSPSIAAGSPGLRRRPSIQVPLVLRRSSTTQPPLSSSWRSTAWSLETERSEWSSRSLPGLRPILIRAKRPASDWPSIGPSRTSSVTLPSAAAARSEIITVGRSRFRARTVVA